MTPSTSNDNAAPGKRSGRDGGNLYSMLFLGVGNAHATDLGSSAGVFERDGRPCLLFDCGPGTLPRFIDAYHGQLPEAVFITHGHMDHVGDLENLFYRAYFQERYHGRVRLFVPVHLIDVIQRRIADYPGPLAEGGANFWDCFQLVPVTDGFWWQDLHFTVFPVRHHEHLSAFGCALAGVFLYSGDTRPIPELLCSYARRGETIFHDCGLAGSPSHTGVDDLERDYSPDQRARMVLYHYESAAAGDELEQRGYSIARPMARIDFRNPPRRQTRRLVWLSLKA